MILRSITLRNFRSYRAETFSFHEKFNLILGENAQGKTNLLEAIHILFNSKPFKQIKMEELITLGESQGGVKGEIEVDTALNEVHIILTKDGKTVKLNGKVIYKSAKISGKFNVVTFLPSDLDLVKGSPQGRRNYFDELISEIDPNHEKDLKSYNRALSQRNTLLDEKEAVIRDRIEVWDERIGELGGRIVRRRVRLIKRLEPELGKFYKQLSGLDAEIGVLYSPTFKLGKSPEAGLKKELRERIKRDMRRGHTTAGPHRDKIDLTIGGKDASVFASQGEAKTLALSLRISELVLIKKVLGKTPVLLLDDIASELDDRRKNFLFSLLMDFKGQAFVTATSRDDVSYEGDMRVFQVKAGKVQSVK